MDYQSRRERHDGFGIEARRSLEEETVKIWVSYVANMWLKLQKADKEEKELVPWQVEGF